MGLIATNTGGKKIPPCPAGSHIARCYAVIDLGQQNESFKGKAKVMHKLRLFFELPLKTYVFKDEKGPEPYTLSKEFTLSMGEKSNLRFFVESWRGKPLTDVHAAKYDTDKLLGQAGVINVIHVPKGDKVYANIKSIMPLMDGMKCPDPINPFVSYQISMGKNDLFLSLPEWVQEEIKKSIDWKVEAPANHPGAAEEEPSGQEGLPEPADPDPF